MGNALAVYDRVQNPLVFAEQLAKPCAALCGCSIDQGQAVALTCLCEGITPLDFQRRYHLIQGKPTMKADAMLAEFRTSHGGNHVVERRDSEGASIQLTDRHGRSYRSSITWDEIQESRWPWRDPNNHDRGLKDNWSTATDRRSMLWARLVSDSLRAFCPEIVAGVYTPEEMSDAIDGEFTVEPGPTVAEVIAQNAAEERHESGEPIDASYTVIDDDGTRHEVEDAPFDAPEPDDDPDEPKCEGFATKQQIEAIKALFASLDIDHERQVQALQKRGVNNVRSLKTEDASEILSKLEAIKARQPKN